LIKEHIKPTQAIFLYVNSAILRTKNTFPSQVLNTLNTDLSIEKLFTDVSVLQHFLQISSPSLKKKKNNNKDRIFEDRS